MALYPLDDLLTYLHAKEVKIAIYLLKMGFYITSFKSAHFYVYL